jgi:hypothetical protein
MRRGRSTGGWPALSGLFAFRETRDANAGNPMPRGREAGRTARGQRYSPGTSDPDVPSLAALAIHGPSDLLGHEAPSLIGRLTAAASDLERELGHT